MAGDAAAGGRAAGAAAVPAASPAAACYLKPSAGTRPKSSGSGAPGRGELLASPKQVPRELRVGALCLAQVATASPSPRGTC